MNGELILYQTEDGQTRVRVRFEGDTVWLSQRDMAELFQTTPQNVTQHIAAVYEDGELDEGATCKEYLQVRSEGEPRAPGRDVPRLCPCAGYVPRATNDISPDT